ncbi:N-acetyltransferase CML2 [Phytophthora nicotianae]|uniref:N-acetyltransferase CML2 n=1 Tax=Phytophthora nicotianae TaxID=4792 RepID=A0A0W8D5N4_PHYNI|nr:N-acetyltransferase CML2 [Phytophthora nicotianae]
MALFYDVWKSRDTTLMRLQKLLECVIARRVLSVIDAEAQADTERTAATHIQRLFRGQRVRAAVTAQTELAAKGDTMRRMLDENLRKQQEQEKLDTEKAAREELVKITQDLHHLVSTRAVAGIFNSPTQAATATSFGVPVESHIRENAHRVVTSRLANARPPSRLAPYPPSNKTTLQATGPYDAIQQEKRKQTKYHKLRRIGSSDFAAVYNPEQDVARKRNAPGINSGTEYVDEWRNPYKKRGVPRNKRDLLPQLTTLGRYPDTPFYLTYGGNKSKVLANDRFDV